MLLKKHNDDGRVTLDYKIGAEKSKNEQYHVCACGKKYKYRQGLHKHKVKCMDNTQGQIIYKNADKDEMILHMLKKMDEQHKIIHDLVQRVGNNNNTNSNNSHNNINIYLNEQCKDAISIQTFAKQLALDIDNEPKILCDHKDHKPLCDLISKRLTILDQTMRPLHSHKKTLYMKDEQDGWNKDENGKAANTVINAAKKAELNKVTTLYPKWSNNNKDGDKYLEAVSHLIGEVTKKERDEFEKMKCLEIMMDE